MDISVVLCTYNNAERLRITLGALCKLAPPEDADWELVAVNNNSTDSTKQVIKSFSGQLPITYVHEPQQGKSRALNSGLSAARGELIVFTDDDVEPSRYWLTAYWEAYRRRPEGYYFGGPIESKYEGEPPDKELLEIAQPSVAGLNYGGREKEVSQLFIGPNWACPYKHFQEVGGFDEEIGLNPAAGKVLVGEETDMMKRLQGSGLAGWYVPNAEVKHFVPESKCTLEHVASRRVARFEDVYSGSEVSMPSTLLGMPLGLYKGVVVSWLRWVTRRVTGQKWKKDYLEWRERKKFVSEYYKSAD
ncbi:glycosyltransferase [Salinibacter altiplanensis]|uniref:glycosyltransferase n=1 Tax=Salinibacter altiplanensis TaxID=1803181 RepID=UPI000C9F56E6|nr:glycosyltransferase [Salinibacter altiplanensis]